MPYTVIKKKVFPTHQQTTCCTRGREGGVSSGRWEYCYKLATCCYLVDKLEITIIRNKKHFILP